MELDATAMAKLTHRAAPKYWVTQHGTGRSTFLLGMEPWVQALNMPITDTRTLWETLATEYRSKLKFDIFQIREERLGMRCEDCEDVDTYALRIDQKVKVNKLSSEPWTSFPETTRTLAKMTNEEHLFYLLRGIPRNDDWQFFLELIMDKNPTATLTPDEIEIKLVEKETMIKRGNGLGQETPLFATENSNGNGKSKGTGRRSGKGDNSDEDQEGKRKLTCFLCHKKGNKVSNCPSIKHGNPPITKENPETAAKDDNITAARGSVQMTMTIDNYLVTNTSVNSAP